MASAGEDIFNDSVIECRICFENMMGEIMMCPTGHSLCKGCFDKMKPCYCPFCKRCMFDTRNISAEKLLQKVGQRKFDNWPNDSVALCSQCSLPMETQIGVCKIGHSLCSDCTKKNTSCKICFSKIVIYRNFLLESCIRKIKKERVVPLPLAPAQIFKETMESKNDKSIICPMPNCSFKGVCLSKHFLGEHKQNICSMKPNDFFRIAVKNVDKNIIFRILGSPSETFIIVRVKVSNTFLNINAEQISKGFEHILCIEHNGCHAIGMYRFKYASNGGSKKIMLKKESLKLSNLREYIVRVSFSKKSQ